MLWWVTAFSLFGLWILAMATSHVLGGAVHLLLIGGIALILVRTWRGQEGVRGAAAEVNRRRRGGSRASSAGKRPAGRA